MTTSPTIPLVQFYGNSVSYQSRNTTIEMGKNGVIGRTKTHSQNAVRSRYSISAIVKTTTEKNTLQTFLLTNKGKPFRFNFDGTQSAGLFTCHKWSWQYKVLTATGGVYTLTAEFNEVFRPAQLIPNNLIIPIGFASGQGFDPNVISYVIQPPLGLASGTGFDPTLVPAAITLSIPLGVTNASGSDPQLTGNNPSVDPPVGFGSGLGFDPTLVPGAVSVVIDLGTASGVGFDPVVDVINPTIDVPLGTGSGNGFDPTLVPGAVTIDVPLGSGSGLGNDPVLSSGVEWDAIDLAAWDAMSESQWDNIG